MKFNDSCRYSCAAVLMLATVPVAMADDPDPRSNDTAELPAASRALTAGGQADDADGRQLYLIADFPLGQRGWTELSLAQAQSGSGIAEIKTTVASLGLGVDTQRVALSARYTHREDSDQFREQDLSGKLDLRFEKVSVGLDLFHRSAESETVTSIERRRRDPLSVRITESIDGFGAGLHAEVHPSDSLSLTAGYMKYDYDSTSNRPALLQQLSSLGISVATREQAFFDSSVHAGASYTFAYFDLAVDYYLDRVLDTGDDMSTGQLTVSIPLGERWLLTPSVGYSTNDPFDSTAFAGLSMSVFW